MKIIGFLKVVVINLISFIVLLFVVNWGCKFLLKPSAQNTRHLLPNYAEDHEYAKTIFKDYNSVQHQYEPFVGWKTVPYNGKTTQINADGMRVHTPPIKVNAGQKSIHFFGGSTMWGEGSDDQHTIPALVNAALPQYNVYNHGQLAYNTRQELDALISTYSKNINPDIVIFYDGVNDAAFLCPKEIDDLPAHRLVPMFRDKIYVKRSAMVKEALYKLFLENIMRVLNQYSNKEREESPYNCIGDEHKAEEIAEIFMRNWEMAHEIVTNRGGEFIAILQPAAFIGNPKTDHLKLDEDLGKNFKEVYRRIKAKIAERNHPWVYDLSDRFDGDQLIYIDFCHVSPNGNQIMAKSIGEIISTKQL
ncbi:MAG TPA: SGNH/GDSL hydrolase family protein [Ohtaekwangia sp.]|nr:SGNH/GDSL hydrolase family protein [Ohtaekwangia sp.]